MLLCGNRSENLCHWKTAVIIVRVFSQISGLVIYPIRDARHRSNVLQNSVRSITKEVARTKSQGKLAICESLSFGREKGSGSRVPVQVGTEGCVVGAFPVQYLGGPRSMELLLTK